MRPIALLAGDGRRTAEPLGGTDHGGTDHGSADYGRGARLAAALIVLAGVTVLAVGAFLISYAGARQIALAAGVSHTAAGIYPVIVDAVLVVACVAALAMRGAEWWMQAYAWLSVFFLLAAIAFVEAAHAAGISLSHRPAAAVMAALPWALFLLGFGLWLSMLRHQRRAVAVIRAERPDGAPWWPWYATTDATEPVPLAAEPDPVSTDARPDIVDNAEGIVDNAEGAPA